MLRKLTDGCRACVAAVKGLTAVAGDAELLRFNMAGLTHPLFRQRCSHTGPYLTRSVYSPVSIPPGPLLIPGLATDEDSH